MRRQWTKRRDCRQQKHKEGREPAMAGGDWSGGSVRIMHDRSAKTPSRPFLPAQTTRLKQLLYTTPTVLVLLRNCMTKTALAERVDRCPFCPGPKPRDRLRHHPDCSHILDRVFLLLDVCRSVALPPLGRSLKRPHLVLAGHVQTRNSRLLAASVGLSCPRLPSKFRVAAPCLMVHVYTYLY